jgi:hypothetical protein
LVYMKKKRSCYIETSVISYLAALPSSNLVTAACQQITVQWWEFSRDLYKLFTSELVTNEVRRGDPVVAKKRLDYLRGISELRITNDVYDLTNALLQKGALPQKAGADGLHIAVASVHGIDFLLTWNCRHIDNPATKPLIREICHSKGYNCPEICSPLEIMEIGNYEE